MAKGKGRVKTPGAGGGKLVTSPPASTGGSTDNMHPVFNLEHLEGAYCLSRCTTDEKAAFADRLHLLSKLTWGEIRRAPRHGLGAEVIDRNALGDRAYPAELTEDVPLLAFRFHGKAPMVGYRLGRVFAVLFLDRGFTLYDHG